MTTPASCGSFLVADDSDEIQRAVVRQLRDTFEIVDVVSTGRQLVDAALALNPDVIVSDFSMPSLNGAEALKALRDAGHAFPFVSGICMRSARRTGWRR